MMQSLQDLQEDIPDFILIQVFSALLRVSDEDAQVAGGTELASRQSTFQHCVQVARLTSITM
jgi:hypothetical protein